MGVVSRNEGEGMTTFDTHDFGQAAALLARGHELIAMHPDNGSKRVVFHFAVTPILEQEAEDYWNGKLHVDAKQYWQESKNLKTRLYGLKP